MTEKLDELAAAGYDVDIKRYVIHQQWKVSIVLSGSYRHLINGYGESEVLDEAISLALEDLEESKAEHARENERVDELARKAGLKIQPRLKFC